MCGFQDSAEQVDVIVNRYSYDLAYLALAARALQAMLVIVPLVTAIVAKDNFTAS